METRVLIQTSLRALRITDIRSRDRGCFAPRTAYPDLLFLAFWDFLAFLLFEEFLAFLSVFPFFSKDFRGSEERDNPCLFGRVPCLFPKKQGKEDQGSAPIIFGRRQKAPENANTPENAGTRPFRKSALSGVFWRFRVLFVPL